MGKLKTDRCMLCDPKSPETNNSNMAVWLERKCAVKSLLGRACFSFLGADLNYALETDRPLNYISGTKGWFCGSHFVCGPDVGEWFQRD